MSRRNTNPSPKTVLKVRERDDGMCILCLNAYGLQTHHRRPRQMGGSTWPGINLANNLITLCQDHHAYIESHREWALGRGYLVSQFEDPANVPIFVPRHGWIELQPDGTYNEIEWEGPRQ